MTINYSSDNDIIIPTQHNTTYRGLAGDDIYIITRAISDGAKINIVDTEGTNIIQLTEGLSISSSKFASTAFQIILSNNAEITISSSHKNLYEIGGNATTGLIVDQNSYEAFISHFGINSLLIRGSSIIAEYYADNFDKNSVVTSWSVAKSFTSTLIGIAIDEGYINSIEDPITDYLPEWKNQDQDKILLKHLLSMRSGMEDHGFVYVVPDMVSHSLDRDIIRPPGVAFRYSNEDSMLLGEIVQNATGMSFQEYADKKVFNLIGADETWWTDQEGNTITYASIDMTPREFAKFGLMIAQEGSWQGQQIVSSNWVELATSKYDDLMSYGFQWWTSETEEIDYPFFSARGLDGQLIYIWPETDLVFVRFTTYKKIGDQDSSVVRVNSVGGLEASYQQTETGNLNTTKLEELLYDVGDNLIMASDFITVNDFG